MKNAGPSLRRNPRRPGLLPSMFVEDDAKAPQLSAGQGVFATGRCPESLGIGGRDGDVFLSIALRGPRHTSRTGAPRYGDWTLRPSRPVHLAEGATAARDPLGPWTMSRRLLLISGDFEVKAWEDLRFGTQSGRGGYLTVGGRGLATTGRLRVRRTAENCRLISKGESW